MAYDAKHYWLIYTFLLMIAEVFSAKQAWIIKEIFFLMNYFSFNDIASHYII